MLQTLSKDALTLGPIEKALFVERPNRFLVRCHIDGAGVIEAFLPNPGRLWELLLPNSTLYLTSEIPSKRTHAPPRRTQHTVLAVERDGSPIFLHTHLTNQVARYLVEARSIPGLEDVQVIRAEMPVGHSRFDFLLRKGDHNLYMEVKSCTLFGNGVAMFPDAVTERGRRHLLELAALGRKGTRSLVLFLVHTSRVRWFMPDYHTDLAFSQTLLKVRKDVQILPVSIGWRRDLSLTPEIKILEIPWPYLRREIQDRGGYLLLLRLDKEKRVEIGRLGSPSFRKGHYIYVGSAMRNLSARIARHSKKRKKLRWHVDYLRQEADGTLALPIRSSERQECHIARALSSILQPGPLGFGSSDCNCPTHLFWHPTDPLACRSFHAFLQRFRMRHPSQPG